MNECSLTNSDGPLLSLQAFQDNRRITEVLAVYPDGQIMVILRGKEVTETA